MPKGVQVQVLSCPPCSRRAAGDDPQGNGVPSQARRIVEAELSHEILPVFFDGFDADPQLRRHLFVGQALPYLLEYFELPRSQSDSVFQEQTLAVP
jgi:hypothetical protein